MRFSYRNEAAFSKAVVTVLRNRGWFVQRIESGETGKGIPDLYCISPRNSAVWCELKRIHQDVSLQDIVVPWRPGQQSWLHGVAMRKQNVCTLCCFNDYIAIIEHNKVYSANRVSREDYTLISDIKEIAR